MRPWTVGLFVGYLAAVAGWAGAARVLPELWRPQAPPRFPHPWREVALALLAACGVLLLGQLWVRGVRLPVAGRAGPLIESVNQLLIFSPMLLLPRLRGHSAATALLRRDRVLTRLGVGLTLAAIALAAHVAVRRLMGEEVLLVPRVVQLQHLDEAVQVLLEDLAIAILLVRFAAAMGSRATVLGVACLFAAGHIPSMLARGANPSELVALLRDVALALLVLGAVLRSGDVLWFWPVHLTMDLTQFARVMGTGPG